MNRPDYLQKIQNQIQSAPKGQVFITSDFKHIADTQALNKVLSRLAEHGTLRRIVRGIYEYPEYSAFLQEYVSPDPDKVARAIARNFGWTIAPCGNTALNMLGLSPQVPAVWSYVSDGPYKTYEFGAVTLQFKHTTNKEITGISPKSTLVIQAIKTLGKENLLEAIKRLKKLLSPEEKQILLSETQYTTAWIYEAVKKICKGNYKNA